MCTLKVVLALGLWGAQAVHLKNVPITQNVGIKMKVEEGNAMEESESDPLRMFQKKVFSEDAKREFVQHNTAFTAMKAYQMTGSASFGVVRQGKEVEAGPAKPRSVWIQSFGRSGSSTVYELILQAMEEEKLFSIFEPCANKDVYHGDEIQKNGTKVAEKCVSFMDDLQQCHFDDVDSLVHWNHKDSKHQAKNYGKLTAALECDKASLRVFKTLNSRNLRLDTKMQKEKHPDTRIVHIVRDPRAIWASQKEAVEKGVFKGEQDIEDLCNSMVWNIEEDDQHRVVTIKFEDLVRRPQTTSRKLYSDLGLEFTDKQRHWVSEHFGKHEDCEENALSTCKRNSFQSLGKWRKVIDKDAAAKFSSTKCKHVFQRYGYQYDTHANTNLRKE